MTFILGGGVLLLSWMVVRQLAVANSSVAPASVICVSAGVTFVELYLTTQEIVASIGSDWKSIWAGVTFGFAVILILSALLLQTFYYASGVDKPKFCTKCGAEKVGSVCANCLGQGAGDIQ